MTFWSRLRSLVLRRKLDADMSEEMRLHLEQRTDENIAAGMSPDEARYAALRKFGGVEQAKEIARDQRTWRWVEQTRQDLRYAARQLRRSPGFTVVVVLTLALAIGANTALFTFGRAIMLRTLPVPDPQRLALLRSSDGDESFSYASYERFRDGTKSFDGLALMRRHPDRVDFVATGFGATESERVHGQMVTGNYFTVLGARAALGRVFTGDEGDFNRPSPTVVLSHRFWQRRFGGDPSVIGRTVQIEQVVFTIVGVMPAGFGGFVVGVDPDLWWPIAMFPQVESDARSLERLRDDGWEWALIVGRLAPGVTRAQASAETQAVFYRQRVAFAAQRTKWTPMQRRDYLARTIELQPGATGYSGLRGQIARPLTVLAVVVGLVLLIACANLAGLLLARGAARQRELAVRAALGAGRGRLVRQLVTESLLLALLGGVAGIALAQGGTAALASYLPWREHGGFDLRPDGTVLAFALGASLLTGVAFALLPAWRLSGSALQAAGRASTGAGRSRLNQVLVVAQIALSVTLLAGAGLFVRSLQKLKTTDLGFRPENLIGFTLEFPRTYRAPERLAAHRRLLDALAPLPEVRRATVSGAGLFSGDGFGIRVFPEGYTPQPDEVVRALVVVAGPEFFATMGIPLRAGREFGPAETPAMPIATANPPPTLPLPRVVIVGAAFARKYFGNADPIGRTLRFGLNPQQPPLEIVGVAADVKYRTVREKPELEIYVPYFGGYTTSPMMVRVATRMEPSAFAATVRALAKQVDPAMSVMDVRPMTDVVDESLMQERVVAQLGGFFSVFALVLASLGLYGVLSYGVTQRTREIGVRMALGARTADVLGLVVGEGVKLALLGTAAGVVAALATTRFAEKLLYGVTPGDPVTFVAVAALLLVVATVAAWMPARRAAKVDPMVALRAE